MLEGYGMVAAMGAMTPCRKTVFRTNGGYKQEESPPGPAGGLMAETAQLQGLIAKEQQEKQQDAGAHTLQMIGT
eukprot:1143307-Pelagomonas_calceolata.AAC.10